MKIVEGPYGWWSLPDGVTVGDCMGATAHLEVRDDVRRDELFGESRRDLRCNGWTRADMCRRSSDARIADQRDFAEALSCIGVTFFDT